MAMAMPSLIREVPGARLFLAGRRKKGPRLRDLCRELGLCNREDMHRAFQGVDAFIFASLASEGFPLVLLEAMALNVSVMASRIEMIHHGESGLHFSPGDPDDLVASLAEHAKDAVRKEADRQSRPQTGPRRIQCGKRRLSSGGMRPDGGG